MVLVCKRFLISDRAGAAVANTVLKDYGIIDQQGMSSIIDQSKLKQKRSKYRKKT